MEYIATKGSTSFKTMLDVESFRRCVEEDEYLSGAKRRSSGVSTTDETYWRDVETATSRSFLGTVGDVSATIRELATFTMVQTRTNATTTRANGWAVLALAMTHAAENEFVASRLLRAARRALRRQQDSDFAEEDVTEFMNLLIAFVRSGPSSSDASGEDSEIAREYRRVKARLTAAFDYANLQDERDWCGNLPGARGMPGMLQRTSRLTTEQEAIVSTAAQTRNGWWCMRLRFGKDDDVGRVRETKPFETVSLPRVQSRHHGGGEETIPGQHGREDVSRFGVQGLAIGTKRAVRRFISAINCVRPRCAKRSG